MLGTGTIQPPEATLSRGLEVHPNGSGPELQLWVDPRYVASGYGWSFPAGEELRIGIGSYDPRFHVKEPTVRLATDEGADTVRYQGNWIPHRFREPVEDGVFFCGDSAGHCLAMSAEGIRTAWYFGIAVGRELAEVLAGARTREQALASYAAFADAHRWKFEWMWLNQRAVRHLHGRPLDWLARFTSRPRADPLAVPQVPEPRAAGVRAAGAAGGAARARRSRPSALADQAEHERGDDREHRQQDAGGDGRRGGALGRVVVGAPRRRSRRCRARTGARSRRTGR